MRLLSRDIFNKIDIYCLSYTTNISIESKEESIFNFLYISYNVVDLISHSIKEDL